MSTLPTRGPGPVRILLRKKPRRLQMVSSLMFFLRRAARPERTFFPIDGQKLDRYCGSLLVFRFVCLPSLLLKIVYPSLASCSFSHGNSYLYPCLAYLIQILMNFSLLEMHSHYSSAGYDSIL